MKFKKGIIVKDIYDGEIVMLLKKKERGSPRDFVEWKCKLIKRGNSTIVKPGTIVDRYIINSIWKPLTKIEKALYGICQDK